MRDLHAKLDTLVSSGALKFWSITDVEEQPGSGMRESEELLLMFPNGNTFRLGISCSGSAENVCFILPRSNQ